MELDLQAELQQLEALRSRLSTVFPGYISHIRFPRYKNISDGARIEFNFPITALVGANGSGKTSVLNALYGAPRGYSTGEYWFSTEVDPIVEGDGSPSRFIYGHYHSSLRGVVETRKARVKKTRDGRPDPNYWEPTKESPGDGMVIPQLERKLSGRSSDRWNPVSRKVLYINFRRELSAFDKYFYFGKDPAVGIARAAAAARLAGRDAPRHKINNKRDRIAHDAALLAKVIAAGDTSVDRRGRKLAIENRALSKPELETVSFVLGRDYSAATWIRHRLFQGDGGVSVVFKTQYGRYSEAFAGSGEVAVTSCVVQVLSAKKGSLVILDEPEVSLHPGAQERLLAFLAQQSRRKQLQVVFSTHSPHFIAELPHDAIKTFYQAADGSFGVINETHPYAAFRRLGVPSSQSVLVIVEDRLAQSVVQHALLLIEDEAVRGLFEVEVGQGGASAILNTRLPVLMERTSNVLVLLDGDQRKVDNIVDPNTIPVADNASLEQVILDQVGARPTLMIDGGAGGGSRDQRVRLQRQYLQFARDHIKFIPGSCPEEMILKAAGMVDRQENADSGFYKAKMHEVAKAAFGGEPTSEKTDSTGDVLLGLHRAEATELTQLKDSLEAFLRGLRIGRLPAAER